MTRTLIDAFTASDGTALTAHTPDAGGSWALHSATPTGGATITGGAAHADPGLTAAVVYHDWTPPSAEYAVEATMTAVSTGTVADGIAARVAAGSLSLYLLRWHSGVWKIEMYNGGAYSLLASSAAYPLTLDQTYALRLEVTDAAKVGYVDGVEVVRSTNNAITASGSPGFRFFSGSSYARFDDFTVDDLVPASSRIFPVLKIGSSHIGPLRVGKE